MPQEAGCMVEISSSQLAMQHLSPCNSSVKNAAAGGGFQEGVVFIWQRLKPITAPPPDLNLVSGLKLSLCLCGHIPCGVSF